MDIGIHRTMKKITTWMSVVVLLTGALVGCGGKTETKEDKGSKTTTETPATTTGATPNAAAPVQVTADTPEQAVNTFLNALQTGNDQAAAALLTTQARGNGQT